MPYRYVRFLLSEDAELMVGVGTPMLLCNLLPAVHAVNAGLDERERLALALPRLGVEDGGDPGEALREIRVFGDPGTLGRLVEREEVARLVRTGMIGGKLRVRELDDGGIKGYAAYVRARRPERMTEAAVMRRERRHRRRAEARGEDRDHDAILERALRALPDKKRGRGAGPDTAYVPMTSSSTGSAFSVFVERREAPEGSAGPLDSYGLSKANTVTEPFAVPVF